MKKLFLIEKKSNKKIGVKKMYVGNSPVAPNFKELKYLDEADVIVASNGKMFEKRDFYVKKNI